MCITFRHVRSDTLTLREITTVRQTSACGQARLRQKVSASTPRPRPKPIPPPTGPERCYLPLSSNRLWQGKRKPKWHCPARPGLAKRMLKAVGGGAASSPCPGTPSPTSDASITICLAPI
ncbi:hypothetical protein chiPu_0009500 [Chiloscyllium punctatum]|uniref:Uncharacterized protein n=1 Tax=Chiloscyllium punctatum TaxID=137246 RepID=A0A401SKY5_CHIPU|nr:hypothetical protein [Chiloscyllium punctatum]